MKISNISKNPYLLFSPFLLLYIIWIIIFYDNSYIFEGDAPRYLKFVQNLTQGFYSPPPPFIDLWFGPGYPLFLAPFIALKIPFIGIAFTNAILQYLSIVFLFKALQYITTFSRAIYFSLFWACYYVAFDRMSQLVPETFTLFLISALILSIVKLFKDSSRKYIILSGLILGFIALTKVLFGYVILSLLIISLILWILNRHSDNYKKGLLILLVALLSVTPYLSYTYSLTNKVFYWGNSGGMSLYWMSTPYENEFGDWFDNELTSGTDLSFNPCDSLQITLNHKKDFDVINQLYGVERDDAYKRIAINNIRSNPLKYVKNCIANASRLLLHFPFSYKHKSFFRLLMIPPNAIILTLMILCFILTLINWKIIPYYIRLLLGLLFFYLGGSILLSAYSRQFYVIVPILIFWFAFTFEKSIKIKFKYD